MQSSESSSLSKQIKFAAIRKSANLFIENSQSSHSPWRLAYTMSTKREFSDLHIIPLEDLEKQLKTNINTGLSTADALEKLKTNGKNVLTPPKKTPEWIKFMKTMFTGFAALLWIAGILCFIAYIVESSENPDDVSPDNLYIGCALVVVVAISGIFTYMQERQSGKIMESFSKMVPPLANVLRDGKVTAMEACDIVLGDVVEIRGGDKVPADLRIFESNALKVDNSSLTGESVAVSLKPNLSDKNRMESRNVAFFSTNVMEGSGRGIVIETGDNTGIGSIARMVSGLGQRKTPISRELDSFIKTITSIAVILGVVFFIVAVCLGTELIKAVIFLIGIIVANVPEGLLVTVTVTLTLTAKRMATKNCLVKNLEAVETLGSTSVICTDKTGTLTQNKMTVAHFWISNKTIALDTGENSYGTNFNKQTDGWAELSRIACLCSAAEFLESDQENPLLQKMKGDASEQGILRCYESIMSNSSAVREANPKVVEIPFNSSNKYQVSVHDVDRSGKYLLVMKGAPEIIFKKCKTILINGQDLKIDETISNDFQKAYMDLGEQGERVLGFCDLTLNPQEFPSGFEFDVEDEPNFPLSDLRFVGLMSMIDPPKSSVPDAVAKCRSAGIKVIMVTGDHPITAAAIARQVGIISEESTNLIYTDKTDPKDVVEKNVAAVVPGGVLLDMEESILLSLIEHHWEIVFARTSPEQKLRIVTAFQTTGAIVAVTGDGVNDSPALKKGDIGVAMGISGSEVSKEAADMILLDDNFATIVTGVEEGRLIFDNLKKSIVYTLTSNIPEILPFLCWVIFSIPLPLSTVCILLIDLGTDMFPAISLAYEKAESDIMQRKPRNANTDRLVNGRLIFLAYGIIGFIQAAAGLFIYFVVMAEHGWLPFRLLYIRAEWDNPDINGLTDSFGQEWSYGQRKVLESTSQTAFFLAIVQVQWTDLIISKTRKVSILTQKMNNWILNSSIVFETVLAIILIYTPVVPQFVGLYPLNPTWWIPALPFSLLILIIDETRRYILRSPPSPLQRFITKETYY